MPDHVPFADNLQGNYTFTAVHSEARLCDWAFIRPNLGAVDFDLSIGEMIGRRFDLLAIPPSTVDQQARLELP